MNDLLIGAVDLYNWEQIKNWVYSINKTGFSGKKVIIAYRVDADTIKQIKQNGFEIVIAKYDSFIKEINHDINIRKTKVHFMRYFHIWQYLNECNEEFRYIISTDTKDVVFQNNPSEWLENNLKNEILAPSEFILIKNENWNTNDILTGYGQYIYEYVAKNNIVINSGTMAGKYKTFKDMCLILYLMTHDNYQATDQATFNVMVYSLLKDKVHIANIDDAWACQCETLLNRNKDEDKFIIGDKPIIDDNGYAYNTNNKQFCILHQYDRIENLKILIDKRYK